MLIKNRDKLLRHNIASIPGGAAYGGFTYIFTEALEEAFLRKGNKYLRDVFTGGVVASSVGSFGAAAMFLPHPDDPKRPLVTAADFTPLYFDRLPKYLPYAEDHYLNHVLHAVGSWLSRNKGHITEGELDVFLKSVQSRIEDVRKSRIKRGALGLFLPKAAAALSDDGFMDTLHDIFNRAVDHENLPLHLDRSFMEADLPRILGTHVTMRDFDRNICITTQKITPGSIEPGDFYRTQEGFRRKNAHMPVAEPEIDVPLYKIILGATAVPTLFDAYSISETGTTHIDCAHVDNRADNILALQANLPDGITLEPVTIGNIRQSSGITPDDYAQMDAISMLVNRFYHTSPGTQSQIRGRRVLRRVYGPDHTHELEISEKNCPFELTAKPDIFDSSPEQAARIRADARAFLAHHEKEFDMRTDILLENAMRVEQHQRGLLGSLGSALRSLAGMRSRPTTEEGILEREGQIPTAANDERKPAGHRPADPAAL
ncbi:MAG: hypothetical protein AB7E85_02695 [Pseudobdellovibrionaceae bacterium]